VRLSRQRLILPVTAAGVTLVVLAPLFWPGYALRYDMVFVPHQPLTWDMVAPANGLPRAVPQDLVVSVLSVVFPGWILQRLALAGAVFVAALGAGRLVPTSSTLTRVVAAIGYAWTPFFAERLLLGQWGLLLAYAALPWLVLAAIGVREARPGALGRLLIAAAASAITPTGGVIALVAVAVLLAGSRTRTFLAGLTGTAVLNAPWLFAALLSGSDGRSDPAGVAAFAARGENWSGPVWALLGTGGIWNAQTTPGSRGAAVAPFVTAVLILLAVAGYPLLRTAWPRGMAVRLAALGLGGLAVSCLGVVPPTAAALEWLVAHVPGAGLLRDGQKFVLPYALLLVLTAALGARRLALRLGAERAPLVLVAAAALPLVALPDLAFGGLGAIRPVHFPDDWERVAQLVAENPGEVVSLPLSEYRRYPWNQRATVIDVAPRLLPAPVTTDDRLLIGTSTISGESARAAQIRDLVDREQSLVDSGARWILVQRDAAQPPDAALLAGLDVVYSGSELSLYRNPQGVQPTVGSGRLLLLVPYVAAAAVLLMAIWSLLRARYCVVACANVT
jgi:hypothetical protein